MITDKAQLAALLKDARARNKLSVEEVATALRTFGQVIAPKTIYNYETGNSMPQVPAFLALCKIYGIDDLSCSEYRKAVEVSETEEALLNCFRSASPELQAAVFRALDVKGANGR